ncbi:MAG: polyketide synthase, partial [Gemmatimonadota bacterium]|nr:polyketide synthase [Gemmatimonadota bacterium]
LQVAEQAIADADLSEVDRLRAGVFVGVELDLNTTNYHLRWAVRSRAADWAQRLGRPSHGEGFDRWVDELCDSLTPALNANRTIGGLGSIAASRVAREFGLGGPSYVISSEETSGLSALYAASRALEQGRIDCAIVGAVDLAGDVRSLISLESTYGLAKPEDSPSFGEDLAGMVPSDGAVALVLKRTEDAERDGDRVYAIVRASGTAGGDSESSCQEVIRRSCEEADIAVRDIPHLEISGFGIAGLGRTEMTAVAEVFGPDTVLGYAKAQIGHTGAAAGLISVLSSALSLYRQVLPAAAESRNWPAAQEGRGWRLTSLRDPTPWVRDRIDGPRRTGVLAVSRGASSSYVILEEAEVAANSQSAGADAWSAHRGDLPLSEGLFVVEGE